MKLLLILLFFNITCYAQNRYDVEINLSNANGKKVYMTDAWGGPADRTKATHVDSAYIINNKCVFKGQFKDRMYYSLAVDSFRNYAQFIIDTGQTVIEGDAKDYLWKSIKVNSVQNNWEKEAKNAVDSISAIREKFQDSLLKYEKHNKTLYLKYSRLMDSEDGNLAKYLLRYTKTHPDCYYTFTQLKEIYNFTLAVTELAKLTFPLYSQTIKNSEEGQYFYSLLFKKDDVLAPGRAVPKLIMYDVNKESKEIKLDKHFYLIDYWASWCGPCIANMPVLKVFEERFNKKGFKIISISIDNNYQNWLAAIKKYKIDWGNYCNLNGFNSSDVKVFGITSIPFMVLVDNNGKIVKLNPTNREVEEYLLKL